MKLIVGLGNPGSKYIKTRHNIGYRLTDELAKRYNAGFKKKLFSNAKEAHATIYRQKLILLQPLTFMNLSGSCVLKYKNKFKIALNDIIVLCDDINLSFGQIRIRPQGSQGGHNGLESIIEGLGTREFTRLRVGIKGENTPLDLADYVLSDFNEEESSKIEEIIKRAADACECWARDGIDKAMNTYNK